MIKSRLILHPWYEDIKKSFLTYCLTLFLLKSLAKLEVTILLHGDQLLFPFLFLQLQFCVAGLLKCSHKMTLIFLSAKSINSKHHLCLWARLPVWRTWLWRMDRGYSQKMKSWDSSKSKVIHRTFLVFWLTRDLIMCRSICSFSVNEIWSNIMLCF